MVTRSRSEARRDFEPSVRLRLVEDDHDKVDGHLEHFADELKTIKALLTGILVSVTTGAILLAIQTLAT